MLRRCPRQDCFESKFDASFLRSGLLCMRRLRSCFKLYNSKLTMCVVPSYMRLEPVHLRFDEWLLEELSTRSMPKHKVDIYFNMRASQES